MDTTFEAIAGSTSDAIVTADADGRVISWNPGAERIFGFSAAEMIGQPLTAIIPEQFHEAHDTGIARVAGGGETHVIGETVQLVGRRKDATEFPVELSLATWLSEGKRFFSGILRDVSGRENTLAELAQSEERLRAIMGSVNDAVVGVDAAGLVVLWNPKAEEMFGRSDQEMLGGPLTAIIPERFRDLHDTGIARVAGGGDQHVIGQTVELAAIGPDGNEFPVELSLGTWSVGEQRFFGGVIRDITERKRAEQELTETNRALDEKNHELEGLSSKLAKYLSSQVYDSIFSGRTDVQIESYRKNLTVFFSDVEGFTEITDDMEAEPLSDLLNRYLSEMATIAKDHGGTIDKFMGDGIMIFFGDPESRGPEQDALACVNMALAMRRRMYDLREEWIDQGVSRPLHIRIGINSGYCTVGNFGSEDRLDYTIVGGEVNATSRLEESAQADQILISGATYALVQKDIYCQPVGEVTVRGIRHTLQTYEVVASREDMLSGMKPLSEVREGFRLALDPLVLPPDEREAAREVLLEAVKALDGLDDGKL